MTVLDAATKAAQRLALAIDLFAASEDLMRQRLTRQHPGLPSEAVEALLVSWLRDRPGAEAGDASTSPDGSRALVRGRA